MIEPPASDPAIPAQLGPRAAFAEQELRLISALVLLLGAGLFLALPFVLSIGSVVFLPLTAALILTIILSPMADRFSEWGVPNALASLIALTIFFAIVLLALALVMQPAITLFGELPTMVNRVGERFSEIRYQFAWLGELNDQLAGALGQSGTGREVVLAGPSVIEQLAFATPSILLETLLTFLMTYFMIGGRVTLRRRLMLDRSDFGASVKAARVMRDIQDRVAAYILTVGLINAGVGIAVAIGAWLLGVDAPVMWGGLAMILNFLPYIGPLAMMGLLALFGIGTSETILLGLIPASAYLGLHAVEANVITPSILGARFTMNPVLILLALSYFSWVWGVAGALLSVPILLTLTAFFDHVGRPNLVGFIFGEPLWSANLMELGEPPTTAGQA